MRDNYECGMHGYVKGGHNYATASLDRILFDCLPRNLWWSWLRRRLVETRQNTGERQRRNRIERERERESKKMARVRLSLRGQFVERDDHREG